MDGKMETAGAGPRCYEKGKEKEHNTHFCIALRPEFPGLSGDGLHFNLLISKSLYEWKAALLRFVKSNITYSEDDVKIVFRKSF